MGLCLLKITVFNAVCVVVVAGEIGKLYDVNDVKKYEKNDNE